MQDFGPDVIGLWLPTLDELLDALAGGGDSRLLAEIHVALLRVVQVRSLRNLLPSLLQSGFESLAAEGVHHSNPLTP